MMESVISEILFLTWLVIVGAFVSTIAVVGIVKFLYNKTHK